MVAKDENKNNLWVKTQILEKLVEHRRVRGAFERLKGGRSVAEGNLMTVLREVR